MVNINIFILIILKSVFIFVIKPVLFIIILFNHNLYFILKQAAASQIQDLVRYKHYKSNIFT